MKVRDHYHSHRLSIWLSLIPRLHIPIELQQHQHQIHPNPEYTLSPESEAMDLAELEPEQYFYLRHHLLPDHENMATYDGVVKQLAIRIPAGSVWQRKHLRQNMTSFYEQHQQMLYGKLYAHKSNTGISGSINSISPNTRQLLNNRVSNVGNEQFAGRRASEIPSEAGGGGGQGPSGGETLDGNSGGSISYPDNGPGDSNAPGGGGQGNGGNDDDSMDFYEISSTATTSVLHYVSFCLLAYKVL